VKKIGINGQLRNKLFLIVFHCFSLVKSAMNAPRICKMHNGVGKTPSISSFFHCQWRKEYSPQLSKLLYYWQVKNKEALFKGLSEDGERADFSQNLPRLSL
jgi:hypothetical protein